MIRLSSKAHHENYVRRWLATKGGNMRITGKVNRSDQGDGVTAIILIDGKVMYQQFAGGPNHPQSVEFDVPANINAGSTVDFAITPGPGLDRDFDATNFQVKINRVE